MEHGPSDQPAVVQGARHGPTVRGARAEASDDAMPEPAPGGNIPPHAAAAVVGREMAPPTGLFQRPLPTGGQRVVQHQEESLGDGMGNHEMLEES